MAIFGYTESQADNALGSSPARCLGVGLARLESRADPRDEGGCRISTQNVVRSLARTTVACTGVFRAGGPRNAALKTTKSRICRSCCTALARFATLVAIRILCGLLGRRYVWSLLSHFRRCDSLRFLYDGNLRGSARCRGSGLTTITFL